LVYNGREREILSIKRDSEYEIMVINKSIKEEDTAG
jgi:hypothetical protein